MDKKVVKQVETALLRAIGICVGKGFYKSQQVVPVVSGELRRSGDMVPVPNGLAIKYEKPYASFVERGVSPGIRKVASFVRNGKMVKGYEYYGKGQKAEHFIGNSLMEAFEYEFADSFESYLRQEIHNIKVIRRIPSH